MLLRFDSVVAGYGRGDILRGLDLDVPEQAVTCLVGPNGAGKSTVLKTLSGLLKPRAGRILFEGNDIAGLSPAREHTRGIVHVPQERSLFPLMTVWDNVLMGGHSMRDRGAVRRRAEALAERFPIVRERRNDRAGELSGGQQKVVEIARALMLRPKLILFDEPTMGLEPKTRHLIFETVARLHADGHTVLLVEQNARAGLAAADHGAVLDGGRVAIAGRGADLLADPRLGELYLGGSGPTANGSGGMNSPA
jgi:branched-chain amino acid transport system ATP-binding protein